MDKLTRLVIALAAVKSSAVKGEEVGAAIEELERKIDKELEILYENWPKEVRNAAHEKAKGLGT